MFGAKFVFGTGGLIPAAESLRCYVAPAGDFLAYKVGLLADPGR